MHVKIKKNLKPKLNTIVEMCLPEFNTIGFVKNCFDVMKKNICRFRLLIVSTKHKQMTFLTRSRLLIRLAYWKDCKMHTDLILLDEKGT